jgi:hypothetical protein
MTVTATHEPPFGDRARGRPVHDGNRVSASPPSSKCLAEQPATILVDASALTVTQDLNVTVLMAPARRAGLWPGVLIPICEPSTALRTALGWLGADRHVTVRPETNRRVDRRYGHGSRGGIGALPRSAYG